MNFSSSLISRVSDLPVQGGGAEDFRFELLDWIVDAGFLRLTVEEREIQVRDKYFRFAIRGETKTGKSVFGFGRSPDKKTAATIAVSEVLERFVSRAVLAESSVLAPLAVSVQNGKIEIADSASPTKLPTPGLHSSNGWAVHFSAQAAIENAAREALERHILLLSYLKHGWSGFFFDEPVPFSGATLIPCIACVEAGGFRSGIVLTTGKEAPGATFGYLCAAGKEFEKSSRWLGAFFESYEQWTDLTAHTTPAPSSVLEEYQRHYLKTQRPALPEETAPEAVFEKVEGHLAVFNLQSVFGSPFPLFAAFVFGGDFLPLFLRQKLSSLEAEAIRRQLSDFGITDELPEYHPIL